jgi:GH25 family lysozyme M1 (1,4-beta-N-acetylmuramidase)
MKPNTCLVVDVWEGQLEIDEAVLKANGVAGMGIRLNDMNGGHHMDTNFVKQWAEAKNFVRFPYFVYNPWVDGAANFAWLAANVPPEAMSVAVDVEVRKPGYLERAYAGELAKFLTLCKSRWKMIIYTAQWFLPYLSSWPWVDYWWAQYPDPTSYFGGVKTWDDLKLRLDKLDKPFNARLVPGNLKMWQFSGDFLVLPGNNRPMDINLFYGTEQDLADYFGTGTTPDPPPPPQPPQKPGLYIFNINNYYERPGGGPLTLPMGTEPRLGDNILRVLWTSLRPVLYRLNTANPDAVDLIIRPDWGPSKGREGDFIKWIGLLWPGRNVVNIREVVQGPSASSGWWGRVDGVTVEQAMAISANDNPDLVHMVYDYNRSNGWGERAKPVYVPLLGGPWYVELKKLVSVDSLLPRIVRIRAFPRLNVRGGPGMEFEVVGYKKYDEGVLVDQMVTGSGGLWGKVSNGWIALRNNGKNWTDWRI